MDCMCRVCETIYGLRNMFDEENEELLLMLRSVANISISSHDLLPKYICEFCSHRLQKSYDFKLQCETTDQKLREILERITKNVLDKSEEAEKVCESKDQLKKEIGPIPAITQRIKTKSDTVVIIDSEEETTFGSFSNFNDIIAENDELSEEDEKEKAFEEEVRKLIGETRSHLPDREHASNNIKSEIKTVNPECTDVKDEIEDAYEIIINSDNMDDFIIEDYTEDMPAIECAQGIENLGNQTDLEKEITAIELRKDELLKDLQTENYKNDVSVSSNLENPKIRGPKLFKCPICPEKFPDIKKLASHRRKHNRWKNKCSICNKYFARKSSLNDHLMIHAGRKVTCDICGAQLSNRGNLLRHIQQCHDMLKPFECDICGLKFARRSALTLHYASHSEIRDYPCDKCGKSFKTQLYLTIHQRRHIPYDERPGRPYQKRKKDMQSYICPHCGKRSKSLPTHLTHMKIHNEVKPFECQECPKKFHFKQTLITHMLTHTGEKPFKCEICGKAFRQQPHLKTHHRCIHLRAKPYQCQYCHKFFTSSSTLKIHERLHTGERPYKCEQCSQCFIESKGLKKHKLLNRCKGAANNADSSSVKKTAKKESQEEKVEVNNEESGSEKCDAKEEETVETEQQLQYFPQDFGGELEIYLQDIHNDYAEIIEVES